MPSRKWILLFFFAICGILLAYYFVSLPQGVRCPSDYCTAPAFGVGRCPAWTGNNGTYFEQECYHFLNSVAPTSAACGLNKTIYHKICGITQT